MNTFLFYIYEILNSIFIFYSFTNIHIFSLKRKNRLLLFFFILISIIGFYSKYGQNIVYIVIVISMIIIAFSNRKHAIQNVSFSLLGYLIYVLVNYTFGIAIEILDYSPTTFSQKHPFITVITIGLVTYTITYIIGHYLRNKFIAYALPKEFSILLLAELAICTGIYAFNIIYGAKYSYPTKVIYFNSFLFFTFFAATMIVLYFIVKMIRKMYILQLQERETKQLKEYTGKLEEINQEMRIFRHDYMNILTTINGYIINEDFISLEKYFKDRILPKGQVLSDNDILISRLSNMEIPEIKGILYAKLADALNNDLVLSFEMREPINNLYMDILHSANIIGNLLDNAIEASISSENKIINIAFIKSDNWIKIIIENSIDTEINLNEIRKKNHTTKENHAGLGLYNVDKILNHYSNIMHTTKCSNGMFCQSLQIFI